MCQEHARCAEEKEALRSTLGVEQEWTKALEAEVQMLKSAHGRAEALEAEVRRLEFEHVQKVGALEE